MINLLLIIICIIGFVLVVIHILYGKSKTFRIWWDNHVCTEFPYEDECFDCKRADCFGCPIEEDRRETLIRLQDMMETADMCEEANNNNQLYRQRDYNE